MGQPANVVDWSDTRSAFDSEIRLASPVTWPQSAEDEGPTGRFHRATLLPAELPRDLDSRLERPVTRLRTLVAWIALDDPESPVAILAQDFLARMDAMDCALDRFATALGGSRSAGLLAAGESLQGAIALWRGRLVDHIDDLALTERDSLDGWSSLPAYSATFTLAFVQPAIEAVREWTVASHDEGTPVGVELRDVEAAVLETNVALERATAGRGPLSTRTLAEAARALAW